MDIIKASEDFVKNMFKEQLSASYSYHNSEHTSYVADSLKTLVKEENISEDDAENLMIAGWFHDLGFVNGNDNHEQNSVKIANQFLKEHNINQEKIDKIDALIMATQKDYQPKNKLEELIRDADCAHLGSKIFPIITEFLRTEVKNIYNKKISKLDWAKLNVEFLTKHQYYSDYAKKNWFPVKQENVSEIRENIKKLESGKMEKENQEKDKALLNKKKLEKMESPERGIETMFRVTLNNHTRLSQIADSKANILLSVNSIIISIALSTLIPKLDTPNNVHLIVPTFIMVMFSVSCIILSILSTRPKVSSGTFTRKEVEDRKVNLLFFGNFYKMPMDEYLWAMKEMMNDRKYLYDAMIKDLYFLGIVLNRKYKLLRLTYTVFMIGIIVSVVAFIVAFRNVTL